MTMISGWGGRIRGLFTDTKGPVGPERRRRRRRSAADDDGAAAVRGANRHRRGRRPSLGGRQCRALDELLRRSRARFGGGDGGGAAWAGPTAR